VFPVNSVEQRRAALDELIRRLKYLPAVERRMRCDQIAQVIGGALPDDLMMTAAHVIALRDAGMQIGAHTVSHPILANLSDDEARREIVESRRSLESMLGERIGLFAYPNGKPATDYQPVHVEMVRGLGFVAAVSTAPGVAANATDPMELPRFTPWDRGRLAFGARLGMNARRPVTRSGTDPKRALY
jgi:peptidoglycan/xylan/chitin deacetylase (PgdA/CDA1 family)